MNTHDIALVDAAPPYIQAGHHTLTRDLALQLDYIEVSNVEELRRGASLLARIHTGRHSRPGTLEVLCLDANSQTPVLREVHFQHHGSPQHHALIWVSDDIGLALLPKKERRP